MSDRYDPMSDPLVLAELTGPHDPEAHLRVQPMPKDSGQLEIVGEDPAELSVVELFERGMLSKSDVDKLRHVVGALTFAEWIDSEQLTPYRITDERLLLVCEIRQRGVADARMLARYAPHQLVPELVDEVQL